MLIDNLQLSSNNIKLHVSCAALNVHITNRIIPHKIHEGILPRHRSRLREQGSL